MRSKCFCIALLLLPAVMFLGCAKDQDRTTTERMLADADQKAAGQPTTATKPAPLEEPSPFPAVNNITVAMLQDAQYAPAASTPTGRKPVPEPLPAEPKPPKY